MNDLMRRKICLRQWASVAFIGKPDTVLNAGAHQILINCQDCGAGLLRYC